MRIFIVRHGQVRGTSFVHPGSDKAIEDAYVNGNPLYPIGDPAISELGHAQARLVGKRLQELGFKGKIYSSPYRRTMQTAQEIAHILNLPVFPQGWLREIMMSEVNVRKFRGMTLAELRAEFDCIAPDATLPSPWWTAILDDKEEMAERVACDLADARKHWDENEDILLIGHGASVTFTVRALHLPLTEKSFNYNCSLSKLDTQTGDCFAYDCTHLPEEYISNNNRDYFFHIPDGILQSSPCRVVHLSDTMEACMPFYREILCTIRPHIILHTGDSVDEMKVGHADCPEVSKERYRQGLATLAAMYDECGAEQIFVAMGNNDVAEWIQQYIPRATIVPQNTVLSLGGQTFALAHAAVSFHVSADNYCYGHTFHWDPYHPVNGGNAYNGVSYATLFAPTENYVRRITIPR